MPSLGGDILRMLARGGIGTAGNILGEMIVGPMIAKRQQETQAKQALLVSLLGGAMTSPDVQTRLAAAPTISQLAKVQYPTAKGVPLQLPQTPQELTARILAGLPPEEQKEAVLTRFKGSGVDDWLRWLSLQSTQAYRDALLKRGEKTEERLGRVEERQAEQAKVANELRRQTARLNALKQLESKAAEITKYLDSLRGLDPEEEILRPLVESYENTRKQLEQIFPGIGDKIEIEKGGKSWFDRVKGYLGLPPGVKGIKRVKPKTEAKPKREEESEYDRVLKEIKRRAAAGEITEEEEALLLKRLEESMKGK